MKLKTLLVLVASMLMSTTVFAQWTKPVIQGSDPEDGGGYYIMNVEAGQYLDAAQVWFSWSTSAGLDDKGCAFYIHEDHGVYTFENNETHKGKFVFISGSSVDEDGEMHVDGGSANTWKLEKLENGNYLIVPTEGEGYWGWKGKDATYPNAVNSNLPREKGFVEWIFVTPSEKLAKANAMAIYNAAMVLKAALEDIEAAYPSVDVADEKAVYNNTESTIDQLNAAVASVKDKKAKTIAAEAEATASLSEPKDMTSSIVNYSFEDGNLNGWTYSNKGAFGDAADGAVRASSNPTYACENADGNYLFNTWAWGYPITQKLENMPNGVYRLGAKVSSSDDCTAVFITAETTGEKLHKGVTLEINPTDSRKQTWFTDGELIFPVTDGVVTIGAVGADSDGKSYLEGGRWWYKVDHFQLTYYGNKADAWGMLASELKKNSALDADAKVSASVKTSYEATVDALTATNYETYKAAVASVEEAKKVVDENIAAWAAYADLVAASKKMLDDPNYNDVPEALDLDDAYKLAVKDIAALTLSTEDVIAKTATLQAAYDATSSATPAGTDVTEKFLKNTDFSKGWEGWNHVGTGGNLVANAAAKCAEAWNVSNFDVYQEVQNAPVGVYMISVQGFYRHGGASNAGWLECFEENGDPKDKDTWPKSTANVYMNDALSTFPNVYDNQVPNGEIFETTGLAGPAPYVDPRQEYWYPNDMTNGGKAFDKGFYLSSALSIVAKKGDPLRIGVKGTTDGQNWVIFTRFKLTFLGLDAGAIKDELERNKTLLEEAVNGGEPMGVDVYNDANELLVGVDEAIASEDGKTMFDVLAQIYPMVTKVTESKAVFAELAVKGEELADAIGEYESIATEEAKTNAEELYNKIAEATFQQGDLTDEEAKELMAQVPLTIRKLVLPSETDLANASDEAPVEVTGFITNPSFETGDLTGWTKNDKATGDTGAKENSNATYTMSECDGAYLFNTWNGSVVEGGFWVAQTVNAEEGVFNIPAGTYRLTCIVATDADHFIEVSVNEDDFSNVETVDKGTGVEGEVIFKIENENDPIAIKVLCEDSWFKADNFRLYYHGTESELVPTAADVIVGNTNKVAKVVKFIKNGKIVILKDGKAFTVAGAQMK